VPWKPPWKEEPLTEVFQDEMELAMLRLKEDEELLLWML
jgi:hypothetical protein